MSCPSLGILGKTLAFTVRTFNPPSVPADADSNPTFSVYEGNSDTPIATGSTSKLNDSNTTGLYVGSFSISSDAGFERYKSYLIDVVITIGGQQTNKLFSFLCVGS